MDGVRRANSGHPGGAMSSADFIYLLFKDYIKFNPKDPSWFDVIGSFSQAGTCQCCNMVFYMLGWMKISDLKSLDSWVVKRLGTLKWK